MAKTFKIILLACVFLLVLTIAFCIFFDQAVLTRKGTIYEAHIKDKYIALTFDDGPSPFWTPKILDELKKYNIKATFFMVGSHAEKYPEIVKRAADEGHEIGNHTYLHHVLIYYTNDELRLEIKHTEDIIYNITGKRTDLFRPPKGWLTKQEKKYIKSLGYKIILWTLNSKDWVTFFSNKYIIHNIIKNVQPGDIILFHDSGGTFSLREGDRSNTLRVISKLIKELQAKGYKFVPVSDLLNHKE